MPDYGPNFRPVCNDLVQFSETTETLVFTRRHALLGYQKSTDTNFIFCPDGSPIDYKKEGIVPDPKGDFYVRVEALLPNMLIEIPQVGKVKILTVELGKLFLHRSSSHGIIGIQLTEDLLEQIGHEMNAWVVTIDKNLFANDKLSKLTYEFYGINGSTVSLTESQLKLQMLHEMYDKMVKDSNLSPNQLVDMFHNNPAVPNKWSSYVLNQSNDTHVSASTALNRTDRMDWMQFILSMLNEYTTNQLQFKNIAATPTTPGGYHIYGNPLEVFVNKQGYELRAVFAHLMIGAWQVNQILHNFLGRENMNGPNDIVKKQNTNEVFIPGTQITSMQQAWDNAFAVIWGNLPDAKTMTTGISNLGDNHGDIGFYKYLYNMNKRRRHAGIAQDLFDAFTNGRMAINSKDYTTRDISICKIRRLVSRVLLQSTLDYLNGSISLVTENDTSNVPSPDRLFSVSPAMGLLYACVFTERNLDYLKIYEEGLPYVTIPLLISLKFIQQEQVGQDTQYGLDTSSWNLLSKDGIDNLKYIRTFVSAALLENDHVLYMNPVTNSWDQIAKPCETYTFFTADSLNNALKESTFTVPIPTYPPLDTYHSGPNYVETMCSYAIPTYLVKHASPPELYTVMVLGAENGKAADTYFKNTPREQEGVSSFAEFQNAIGASVETIANSFNYAHTYDVNGLIIPNNKNC